MRHSLRGDLVSVIRAHRQVCWETGAYASTSAEHPEIVIFSIKNLNVIAVKCLRIIVLVDEELRHEAS